MKIAEAVNSRPKVVKVEGQLDQVSPGEGEDVVWVLRDEEAEISVHVQQGEFVRRGRESIFVKDANNVGRRFVVRGQQRTKGPDGSARIYATEIDRLD